LVELLEEIGAQIVGHADSASCAIEDIAAANPDIAVVDIGLREGNGFDVLRALKLRKDAGPIGIVLTNFTTRPYRAAATRLGASYFFDKNQEIVAMLGTVARIARSREFKTAPA
jgi:DNA-binding NarL/FixJ family response regulator